MLKRLLTKIPGALPAAQTLGLINEEVGARLHLLSLLPEHSVGAEIGVYKGNFSASILEVVRPSMLHLIDPWEHQTSEIYEDSWYGGVAEDGQSEMDRLYLTVCDRFGPQIDSGQVVVHRGYSADVLPWFPDEYLDWVYIDGNHLYEYVLEDLALSLQKTRTGGLIAGDDYGEVGWWQDGVKTAVDEFVTRQGVELVEIRRRQFLLRKTG